MRMNNQLLKGAVGSPTRRLSEQMKTQRRFKEETDQILYSIYPYDPVSEALKRVETRIKREGKFRKEIEVLKKQFVIE